MRNNHQSSKERGVTKIARVALSPDNSSIGRFADKYFLRTKDIVEKFGHERTGNHLGSIHLSSALWRMVFSIV